MGSLRMPSVEPPRLAFGVSGHAHDPHGVMGLVVDPAIKAIIVLYRQLFGMGAREPYLQGLTQRRPGNLVKSESVE